jgi:hypothetical protein
MNEPINPARSEGERALWHTLDEAGWSVEQIRKSFAAYRDEVLRDAAEKIRQRAVRLDGWPRPGYWKGYLAGARDSASLIDPDKQ